MWEQLIKCYLELVEMASSALCFKKTASIVAIPSKYDTVDIFVKRNLFCRELIDFDCLQLKGKIQGEKQLATMEDVYYSWPDIDCVALAREITQRLKNSERQKET